MALFQSKTSRVRPRKREKKNYRSDQFLLNPEQRIPKKQQKIQKIKKHHYDFISSQIGLGEVEKDKKKNLSFQSVPIQPRIENSKKIAKKFQKLKNIMMASFQVKTGRERPRKRKKNLLFQSVPARPGIENSKKITK